VGTRQRFQPACGGAPSLLFWAGAIQSAAGPGRFSIEAATREVFLRHTNSRISLDLCAQAGIAAQGAGTSLFGWYSTREKHWANWTKLDHDAKLPIPCKCLKELAGTTGLEPAASAVTAYGSEVTV
jgi:hypothetical protein